VKRSLALVLFCTHATLARAQVPPDAGVDAAPPDATTDAPPDSAPPSDVPPPVDAPAPLAIPIPEPIVAEHPTTSTEWSPGYHFDLHWRLLMLPERVIELVFLPISLVVGAVEEYRIDKRIVDGLTWATGRNQISPRFKFSLGDGAGIGLWVTRKKLFDNRARLRLGGIARLDADWQLETEYRHALLIPGGRGLRTRAYVENDKNRRFFGIGGGSEVADRRVLRSFEQGAFVEIDLQGIDRYTYAGTAGVGLRRQELLPGTSSSYMPVGLAGDTVVPPAGFDDGAIYAEANLTGRYDTRDTFGRPTRGTLATVRGFVRQEVTGKALSGMTLDASVNWHLPVLPDNRVLVLSIAGTTAFALRPGSEIPLDSLAVIGRQNVRGYDRDRFLDRHALQATLEYRFPIYEYLTSRAGLDAFVFVDGGTIWGKSAFDAVPPLWSTGGGIRGAHDTTLVFTTTVGYSPEGFQLTVGAESSL
jgi:Omp85 superfamily domain